MEWRVSYRVFSEISIGLDREKEYYEVKDE